MMELRYVNSPLRTRIFWTAVYGVILTVFLIGMYQVTSRIRTHSLPSGEIQLAIPYSKYVVGEIVTYSLQNNFNSPVYILNKCPNEPLAVYRFENNQWVRQHDTASISSCPGKDRQIAVPANGIVNGTFAGWKNLFAKPGKYRVVAYVEYYNALPYQEFEVINPPPAKQPESVSTTPQVQAQPKTSSNTTQKPASPPESSDPKTSSDQPAYTQKQSKTVTISQGSISVQYDAANIYVISIAPASGCTYEGGKSGRQVEVTFKCSGNETQLQLSIVNGQLTQKVESGD